MQWIVLDLEWNQPTSYQSAAYKAAGDKLLFEVIQFGAAKLNERFEIVDTLSVLVRPTYYRVIHSRVKRMTGITFDLLCDADPFPEAFERFMSWCGEDCTFLTWGGDDISVLKQNMDCFGSQYALPRMFDIQRLYAVQKGKKSQVALKTAMEELGIEPDENRAFHNAVHDAYYTALVWKAMPEPAKVLLYEEQAHILAHNEHKTKVHITDVVESVQAGLEQKAPQKLTCPHCATLCALDGEWIPQAKGKYIALCKCRKHGQQFAKAYFYPMRGGKVGMNLSITKLNYQNKAYIHTKLLQYQYKKSRGVFDDFDPEDLSGIASNMPFED